MEETKAREAVIQVKDLYKIYRMGDTKVHALDGVDFEIYRGEFCAITGPSGSGNSTLLNNPYEFISPSEPPFTRLENSFKYSSRETY